jgi:hypothetical protein
VAQIHVDTVQGISEGIAGNLRQNITAKMKAEVTRMMKEDLEKIVEEAVRRMLSVVVRSERNYVTGDFIVHVRVETAKEESNA